MVIGSASCSARGPGDWFEALRVMEMSRADVDLAIARHDSPIFQGVHDAFQGWNDAVRTRIPSTG